MNKIAKFVPELRSDNRWAIGIQPDACGETITYIQGISIETGVITEIEVRDLAFSVETIETANEVCEFLNQEFSGEPVNEVVSH